MLRITLSCIPRSCNDVMQEWQVHRKQWLTTSRWVDASEELEEGLRSGSRALPVGDTKASMPNPFARIVIFGSVKDWFSRDTEAFAGFCTYLLNRDEQVEVGLHVSVHCPGFRRKRNKTWLTEVSVGVFGPPEFFALRARRLAQVQSAPVGIRSHNSHQPQTTGTPHMLRLQLA